MKKSKERREEPLGTMSYQTSSKRSPPLWLLIGARKLVFFWHQSEATTAVTIWNWSGKTLSPGALLAVLYFFSCHIFFRPFRLSLAPFICPWVSEDANMLECKKGANFSIVCTAKVNKTSESGTYVHPYFPTIFHITKSGLSLNNKEILYGEHVKL